MNNSTTPQNHGTMSQCSTATPGGSSMENGTMSQSNSAATLDATPQCEDTMTHSSIKTSINSRTVFNNNVKLEAP